MNEELKSVLKKIPSEFFFDQEGVLIKVQLQSDFVFRSILVYDGKNHAILGRNNKDFYLLSSIDPIIRKKLLNSKTVTIAENSGTEILQAYETKIEIVDDIGFDDTYIEDLQKHFFKLEQMYGKERVENFKQKARNALRNFFKIS